MLGMLVKQPTDKRYNYGNASKANLLATSS